MFPRVALAVLLGALAASTTSAQNTCARNYTVRAGDTCNGISAAQNVSTYQLASANTPLVDPLCDNLAIDEVLCLAFAGQDCTPVHVVASGDTCASIAAAAGTSASTLLANNPNVYANCTNIYSGEVLCTATTVVMASA